MNWTDFEGLWNGKNNVQTVEWTIRVAEYAMPPVNNEKKALR